MSHKLTPKQIKAVYLLAAGMTTIEAGKQLDLRRETLSRWKKIPEFAIEFERVTSEQKSGMCGRLVHLAGRSIDAIDEQLNGPFYAPKRLKTALNVLKQFEIGSVFAPNVPNYTPNVPGQEQK